MKRFIFILVFSILTGSLALSLLVRSTSMQKWATEELEQACSKILEKRVSIGSIDGVLPFVFSVHNIQLYDEKSGKKVASISHIRAIPNWFTCIFGKIAFFQLQIDGVALEAEEEAHAPLPVHQVAAQEKPYKLPSITSYLPNRKISIHSLSCTNIRLSPNQTERYAIKGTLFWNAKSEYLTSSISVESSSLSSLNASLKLSKKEVYSSIEGTLTQADAEKLQLKASACHINAEFSSCNRQVLEELWQKKITRDQARKYPFGCGKLVLHLIVDQELKEIFPSLESLSFSSTFELSDDRHLSFELAPIKAYRSVSSKPIAITSNIYGKAQSIQGLYYVLLQAKTVGRGDFELDDVEMTINCKNLKSLWAATIGLDGNVTKADHLPLHFESSLLSRFTSHNKRLISFQNSIFSLGKTTLHGDLDLLYSPSAPLLVKGKIEAASDDLAPIGKLFQMHVIGKGTASALFDVQAEQTAKINCSLTNFRTQSFGFDSLNIAIDGQGKLTTPYLKATLQVSNGAFNHIEIDAGTLNTQLDLSQQTFSLPFQLDCQGKLDKGPFSIDLAGEFQKNEAIEQSLLLQKFAFSLDQKKAQLVAPTRLTMKAKEASLSFLHIAWEKNGLLQCSAKITEDSLSGTFLAQAVPLDFLHFFFPKTYISGSISGDGSLLGTKTAPELHLNMKTNSLVIGTQKQDLLFPFDMHLSCNVDEKSAEVTGEIQTKESQKPLVLQLAIPVRFSNDAHFFNFLPDEKIKGSLRGVCEISPFLAPFLQEDEIIEGALCFDLSLSGQIFKPEVYGNFSWRHGKLDILKTGAIFTNIVAEGSAYGNSIIFKSVTCQDEKNGRLTAQGKIECKPDLHFPYVLHLDAQDMEFVRRDFAQVTATGKAELIGNFQKADLRGTFVAKNATLNLTNDFSQTVPTLDFIYVNHPESLKFFRSSSPKNNFALALDLDVALPNSGTIKGRGLDSIWKGDLKISGTTEQTLVHGKISVNKGTFSFANKEFNLQEGSIDCAGDIFSQSRLNVVANADLGQIRAQLFLRGSLEKPRIALASIPLLQEREILSWILFNKPIAEVSYMQGLQLAQTLLSMNGGKASKFNIIDKFKKTFGIDHIDVSKTEATDENQENEAVAVQVGKYLSKDVFVKLSKDITNAANRVAIEANLHKNVSVEAEVGDDEEGQMSLMWKHDY